jgi:hypothetical protein
MYLEILHDVVAEILANDKEKSKPIEIHLTPLIYETLQLELNDIITFKTDAPIEEIHITEIKFYERGVTLVKSNLLNTRFERKLIAKLAELESLQNQYRNNDKGK